MEVNGSRALVTGGARGIGRATAAALAQRGAQVTIADVDAALAQATARELGRDVRAVELDVRDADAWAALPAVDVLVNNAGLMHVGAFLDEDAATTRRQLDVNVLGVVNGCQAVLPGMVERGRGAVVNIASQAGKAGFAGVAVYSATKFAVVGLSQSLADELVGTGVALSCVMPGIVDTELSAGLPSPPGMPRVSPAKIADAVVRAVETGRRETWVPNVGRATIPVAGAIPPGARRRLGAVFGLDQPVLRSDADARAAYEARIRG